MANYKKSFNFRNGVQVDDDNFIINANGLVGIGTSIPSELLDVYGGTVKVTGLVTATSLYGKNSRVENLQVDQGINASGIITGSVFSGSAAGLTGFYAVATDGWYIDSGNSGIFTSFKVGIGTTNPIYQFQVGNNPLDENSKGLYIDIDGNLYSSGVSTFSGLNVGGISKTGTLVVTGVSTLNSLNASGLTTTKDLIVTGVSTLNSLNVSGLSTTKDLIVTGISTLGFLNVSGLSTTKDLIVTGISTINTSIVSSLTVIENSNTGITSTKNLFVNGISTFTGFSTFSNSVDIANNIKVYSNTLLVGFTTVSDTLYTKNSIGIGTNIPNNSFHLRKNSDAKLQITSDNSRAEIIIGRSVNEESNNSSIRFGNTSLSYPYSTPKSLDIINFDTGNINFYLESGTPGINTGSFYWNRKSTINLLTLTYDGNLGIGKTDPKLSLDVVGTTTCSADAFVGNNLYVRNNSQFTGTVTVNNNLSANQVTGIFNGPLRGNVEAVSGLSTFYDMKLDNNAVVMGQFAVNGFVLDTLPQYSNIQLAVNASPETLFAVDNLGRVSIGSTLFLFDGINVPDRPCSFGGVAVGTDRVYTDACTVDFTHAGRRGISGDGSNPFATREYMRVPCVTTTERNNFTGLIGGEIIYNKTTDKHQGYSADTGWENLY
jgi:hypothetical protein